ncbi:MAG: SdrD B-like domain-containing protein, partial [Clostridia bacterium]
MSGKSEKKISFNKKLVIAIFAVLAVLVVIICVVATKSNVFNLSGKEDTEKNAGVTNGDKGYISSAQIIQTKTGTGPWDADDEPGNDSSEDNNIVRSFDQVTWTVDLTMALKSGVADSGLTGGIINVEVTLPETCADVMKWDLDSMQWIENGKVSSDGRTLTGQYSMSETDTTIPGKQTLVFVLDVEGAGNKTEIIPTFTFDLEGNEENDKVTITGEKIIVSAKGKYNIQLHRNEELATKTTVDYGEGNTEGRMYGYTFAIQLYNDNESKGLKGMEYPKGELSFDIDLKLERSTFESEELEDITNECTPILWQYNTNNWNNVSGKIANREFYRESTFFNYDYGLPLGIFKEQEYSTYNSGNINIRQDNNKLKVTINGYGFNGIFPHYDSAWNGAVTEKNRHKIYTDNIGTFSVGYMQIFVPDNDASTIRDRNYYLTVSDNNMNVTTSSDEKITTQMKNSDDNLRIQHVLYKPGSYSQYLQVYDQNGVVGSVESNHGSGDGRSAIGSTCSIYAKFANSLTNYEDIYTANKFIKFDGEGYEPVYYSDGSKYRLVNMNGNPKFRVWYATKKDGTNWKNQSEMNNGNIEDMDIYDNIEDIPENKICIGVYIETIDGYISRFTGDNNTIMIQLKIRETATIGKTYGMTQRTQVWTDKLDRDKYSVLHPENEYPTPTWDSGNLDYIKTEYNENGEMISGTHSGGFQWGNTVLVVGANLHGNIEAIDENETEKENYDLGKNENVVTYSVEPQLDGNTNIASQIENVTLKAEVTLPQGLTYIPGSTEYGEPEITNNSNGSQTLIWYIYGVISGQAIEPIRFNTQIDNETENGKQYDTKFVISEVVGSDGISKIGNSKIDFRTSTETINVINLASHRLYKEVETPIIEKNGQIKYNISYQNNTDETVPEFQLLDILPYNGDSRGTKFEGTYTLESVKVNQTVSGATQSTKNLQLFTTNSDTVRNMTAKDDGIGTDSIWTEKTIGSTLNENATGIALKGTIQGRTRLEIELTLNTSGNTAKNVYGNNSIAQVYVDSEQMQTGTVQAQVVSRKIQGKVWEDSNRNGVIDTNEKYLEGTVVKLLNSTNNAEVTRATTNTQGEYEFADLAKGTYKVEVEIDNLHELTDKEVGTNREINSKFNQTSKQTDEITRLNTISSPELIEDNVNAGIRTIQFNITTKVEGVGGNISGEGEAVYEKVDKGQNSEKDIIVSPNMGYRVNTITVNGQPIEFTEEENHIVILNKFINMQENKEVVVTFKKIETSVLVHHYKENTTEQLSKDVTINGEVGDSYTTQVATDIPQNYELVTTPTNATGTMTEDQIVVTYYYRLKTPNITNQVINKTGTDRITVANQEMNYSITYRTEITDYIGNAEVTIIDTLPYAIDEGKSDLAGGTYDSTGKTITWTENISNINSFTGNGTVSVTKNLKVVYVGLDMNQEKITNNVKGNIKLLTPEKISEEVTGSQESTIYKAEIRAEKLVDKTEAIEGEKVTYTIRITNEGNLAKTVTVRDTLPAGITFDNDTLIQVGETGTVYTEQNLKNGIPVEVPANGSIDVVFAGKVDKLASNEYSKTLTNQATVDNEPTNEVTTNVTKANITAHKEAEPVSGNKVRLGDEITYRIRVRNDGTREGTAIVKDTIPTGTTFVEGSIKIDNVADSTKTATDLQNGISITVGVGAEKVVEFKVTVNKLIDGTKIKNTAYINQNGEDKKVPEEPEHTYVEPKEEQSISKNGTATIDSLNGEITYNINYTARITDYAGRATVKLVDTLPYAIDEAKSDLAGGTYDAQAQTITWEEAVEGIQLTEEKEVTINKTVKVVYTGISQETTAIKNVVTGHIEYETPEMTSDEVTANWTTTTGFIV